MWRRVSQAVLCCAEQFSCLNTCNTKVAIKQIPYSVRQHHQDILGCWKLFSWGFPALYRHGGARWRMRTQSVAGHVTVRFASRYNVLRPALLGHSPAVCHLAFADAFVIIDKAWWPHGQDARTQDSGLKTHKRPPVHACSPCRGPVGRFR